MKKCFLSFALLFLSFSSYSLPVMKTVETSDLYKVNSEDSGFDQFIKGKLTMNYKEKMISVYLLGKNTCPPNVMCVAGPRTELLEAPITNRSVDTCGVVAYTAKENKLPVDGIKTEMTVRDFTHVHCRMRLIAPTVVRLKTEHMDRLSGHMIVRNALILGTTLKKSTR